MATLRAASGLGLPPVVSGGHRRSSASLLPSASASKSRASRLSSNASRSLLQFGKEVSKSAKRAAGSIAQPPSPSNDTDDESSEEESYLLNTKKNSKRSSAKGLSSSAKPFSSSAKPFPATEEDVSSMISTIEALKDTEKSIKESAKELRASIKEVRELASEVKTKNKKFAKLDSMSKTTDKHSKRISTKRANTENDDELDPDLLVPAAKQMEEGHRCGKCFEEDRKVLRGGPESSSRRTGKCFEEDRKVLKLEK